MSRSNDFTAVNPAKKYLSWKGEISIKKKDGAIVETNKHHFVYYDREKKENIEVPLPITFFVLDILHTVKGFNEEEGQGFYSNEIRGANFKTDTLKVRLGKHDEAEGLYADIMPGLKSKGAKYCQSVYVLMKEDKEWVINNIQIMGAAVAPWVDFCKNANVMKCAVTVKEWKEEEKGTNSFNAPVFHALPVSADTDQIAKDMDKELQEYLDKYFKAKKTENLEANAHKEAEEYLDSEEPLPTIAEQKRQAEEYKTRQPKEEDYATDLPF